MAGSVPESVKSARSARLRAAVAASRERFIGNQRGRVRRIIVEREMPLGGITSNYLHVEIPDCRAPHNSWREVVLDGTMESGRYCAARLKP
jgi:tRNA A37 methylthiotransferase MiaB